MQRLLLLSTAAATAARAGCAALITLAALATPGCVSEPLGAEANDAGPDGAGPGDAGGGEADGASAGNGGAGGDGGAAIANDGATWTTPTFELGTNLEGKAVPSAFVAKQDGDTLQVTKGPQGLWMVVLAFRTCGLYTPPLVLRARIATDDEAAFGKVDIAKQKLHPGPDGLSYYYNFWLVVENPESAGGKMADVELSVEDAAGHVGVHTLRAALEGGVTVDP